LGTLQISNSARACLTAKLGAGTEDLRQLEIDGQDRRNLPLGDRRKRLARLLTRRGVGIVPSEHTADDGATIFRQACRMGLEGIVSKKLSSPYRSGRSTDWLTVKNPDSPAMVRHREEDW
jgi:bifunctional non-homologous end joining protein LigD